VQSRSSHLANMAVIRRKKFCFVALGAAGPSSPSNMPNISAKVQTFMPLKRDFYNSIGTSQNQVPV
jgi:hypothetical protein